MIVFDLECRAAGHRFEGWFGSSEDFADQQERGLLSCPACGDDAVIKAPMAPNVGAKGNTRELVQRPRPMTAGVPAEVREALRNLAEMQERALRGSQWVGDRFAEESRAIHYGEREHGTIHGQATLAEAKALIEEGVPVAPLAFPVAPPEDVN